MSAFVVRDEVINAAVSTLDWWRGSSGMERSIVEPIIDLADRANGAHVLALGMKQLNVDAVNQRYPNHPQEEVNGFRYTRKAPETKLMTLKRLECWHYQCSEGDCPDRQLYKTMEQVIERLKTHIVHALPEYDALPWS